MVVAMGDGMPMMTTMEDEGGAGMTEAAEEAEEGEATGETLDRGNPVRLCGGALPHLAQFPSARECARTASGIFRPPVSRQ